tara:strand:+ start:173 stop:658 length:486 start_codon:yes stop_codon:yes gene_type:complete
MRLELKNIKHSEWSSEETHCYQASLFVDGKPVAVVVNDGHGGPDMEYDHPKFKGDYRAKMAEVHEYFASLPKTDSCDLLPDGMEQSLEFWCADQINDWLTARDLKRKMRNKILVQKEGRAGIFGTKHYPTRTSTEGRWSNGIRILNDLPFDEALAIWKETA